MPNASPRPGLLLGLIRARARCSRVVPVLVVPCSPSLPISGRDGGPTYLRGGGFLPSRKCLGASSPPTPLNGYTFTLFRRHPCRHGRPSIRLRTIHVHYCERLVPFPTHDNSSSIQHLGDKCRAEPRELQLRSPRSFQRYVVDPYQLSRLVLSPLDLAVFCFWCNAARCNPARACRYAIPLGVRPLTHSLCLPPLPVPGVLHT